MKNKDTLLLEAAYSKMYTALTPDGPEANEPGHYNALTPDGPEANDDDYEEGNIKDLSMIDNLIKQLKHCKSSGVVRLVFTTPDESQDFQPTKVEQQGETDSAWVYLKPL